MEVKNKKIYNYISNSKLNIRQVIKDYTNYVYTIIDNSFLNLSKEDSEEIVSDVFVVLWNNQQKLNINNAMSSYIAGITRNLIRQKSRYVINNCNIDDYEDSLISSFNVETNYLQNEDFIRMIKHLEKMKPEDKKIFALYYYDEKRIKDICLICNMSESKVKSKLFRMRKILQKELKRKGGDFNGEQ